MTSVCVIEKRNVNNEGFLLKKRSHFNVLKVFIFLKMVYLYYNENDFLKNIDNFIKLE